MNTERFTDRRPVIGPSCKMRKTGVGTHVPVPSALYPSSNSSYVTVAFGTRPPSASWEHPSNRPPLHAPHLPTFQLCHYRRCPVVMRRCRGRPQAPRPVFLVGSGVIWDPPRGSPPCPTTGYGLLQRVRQLRMSLYNTHYRHSSAINPIRLTRVVTSTSGLSPYNPRPLLRVNPSPARSLLKSTRQWKWGAPSTLFRRGHYAWSVWDIRGCSSTAESSRGCAATKIATRLTCSVTLL
jgi:hypothetical protein